MDHPVKTATLLGMSVLGAVIEPLVNSSSGLECMSNKACTPGLRVMGDEPASESVERLMANPDIASGSLPPMEIIVTPAPGWTVTKNGKPVVTLPVRLPPGRYPTSVPVALPTAAQTAPASRS
jgi:hypothetical protein